jgi:hypothetical protein
LFALIIPNKNTSHFSIFHYSYELNVFVKKCLEVIWDKVLTSNSAQHRSTALSSVEWDFGSDIVAAAQFLDVRRDTIEARMIDWRKDAVQYRICCGGSELNGGQNFARLCYRADVEAVLKIPEAKGAIGLSSGFHHE